MQYYAILCIHDFPCVYDTGDASSSFVIVGSVGVSSWLDCQVDCQALQLRHAPGPPKTVSYGSVIVVFILEVGNRSIEKLPDALRMICDRILQGHS